jgi:hypothetical protein
MGPIVARMSIWGDVFPIFPQPIFPISAIWVLLFLLISGILSEQDLAK